MQKLIIAALLVVGMTTFAQEKKEKTNRTNMERITPEERQERQLQKLSSELSLNTAQQEQIKVLLTEQAAGREKRMDRNQGTKEEMKAKREASMNKMQNDRKIMEDKMKAILTAEQFGTYKSNQDKMRERAEAQRKERMGDRMKNDNEN
jgi:protein CpxP